MELTNHFLGPCSWSLEIKELKRIKLPGEMSPGVLKDQKEFHFAYRATVQIILNSEGGQIALGTAEITASHMNKSTALDVSCPHNIYIYKLWVSKDKMHTY